MSLMITVTWGVKTLAVPYMAKAWFREQSPKECIFTYSTSYWGNRL